eukprot:2997374-Pyramimonas_sp.AAC.1
MTLFPRVCAISRLSAIVAPRMILKVKVEDEQASCSRPLTARWGGGNQYGYYSSARCATSDCRS